MTVHDLHDALNLLPGDLITAADRLRTVPKTKVISWQRWVAKAAVLALVLGAGLVFRHRILPGVGGLKMENAAEAPAAMAPAPMEIQVREDLAADEATPEEMKPAAPQEAPAESGMSSNSTTQGSDEKTMEEELYIDHSHSFTEESQTVENPVEGYCGNLMVTIYTDGAEYSLSGSDAVAITDILINLDYDPDHICRCVAEFTVDTETLTDIQVSLGQAFARCEQGQAALTERQARIIQEIIDSLQ